MITFCGYPLKITDAVFADHIKVERTGLFCGREAYAAFHAYARNPAVSCDALMAAIHKSRLTNRSVRIETSPATA